ncbi:Isopentenyl-diphosphate delta-isomerase, type 1 like protein [Aduncisulcus paluster]|uniref:isopentenyl-diphosphate Delta-isomerase n=1 Tax=Aduncisulcus paluster TaxID=2918883 RepID=A0ABQ5KTH1_9EUKA|nr:Isopentenyl-diphosphate delta-isomerase, type 1 like protein [Aduncisulcus paluster]
MDPKDFHKKYIKAELEALEKDMVILTDEVGKEIGKASKLESHIKGGLLHKAFSLLLFNVDGELLLQQRAACKITFPLLWSNTVCSHPLYVESERYSIDGVFRAVIRRTRFELGLDLPSVISKQFHIATLLYSAGTRDGFCEKELDYIICAVVKGDSSGIVDFSVINKEEVKELRWISRTKLEEEIKESPDMFSPWFKLLFSSFLNDKWKELGVSEESFEKWKVDGIIKMSK